MFQEIFWFELVYRLRRPAFYVYFLLLFAFGLFSFATGDLPVQEKEFINAPAVVAVFASMVSIFLMLVSSSIMGVPLYRDIEHNTREYYLSYPITKAGYFWGRFLGSFVLVLVVGMAPFLGARVGSLAGPALGWTAAERYGPHVFWFYWQPYCTIVAPSLFFTSSLFFGLVAVFRNVKVIYSGGLFLFLGYLLANFFLLQVHDPAVIYLGDPFMINGLRYGVRGLSPDVLNHTVIPLKGLFLANRVLWVSIGAVALVGTYARFSFERWFGAVRGREKAPAEAPPSRRDALRRVPVQFDRKYVRGTLGSLVKIELLNIIRDNYFWIILSGGIIFLSFVFWHGPNPYGVPDLPRTPFFMDVFANAFIFFVFLIIIFYTGETVHRERLTRYALINDALPPPTWVLSSAKLASLLCLGLFLSLVPVVLGISVQLLRGYTFFNLSLYGSVFAVMTLPKLVCMVLFSYALHITVNNKWAAHGIGITVWTLMVLMSNFHYFDYNLLLYSYTPFAVPSDMDGIGHMTRSILWFDVYWLVAGASLVVLGSLFYGRGVGGSMREKRQLAWQRWRGTTRLGSVLLLVMLLGIGGYIYYQVSYRNEYLTATEKEERSVQIEKSLKRYEGLPLPAITRLVLQVDLYPGEQRTATRGWVTIRNNTDRPIDSLLLDGDRLTDYSLGSGGRVWPYVCPLYFHRGAFSLLRPVWEASDYRVYHLPSPLLPGDTTRVELYSEVRHPGFENGLYAAGLTRNGTFFLGGLPGAGYDGDEELRDNAKRKVYGLAPHIPRDIPHDDPMEMRKVLEGSASDPLSLDLTVSTAGDQTVVAPGTLVKEWMAGGRHYFHYVQEQPLCTSGPAMLSARYAVLRDTVWVTPGREAAGQTEPGRMVKVEIYYYPEHGSNLSHLLAAVKDGLRYGSRAFGVYPYDQLRLAESTVYGPFSAVLPGLVIYSERFGWNADLRQGGRLDYPYYEVAGQIARQWWGVQVLPNNTVGSKVLTEGLSRYVALMLMGHRYGRETQGKVLQTEGWDYGGGRARNFYKENDLLHANQWHEWNAKAGLVLYGLAGLVGEDSLNAALAEFVRQWAFRERGPYAGTEDLYSVLERHVPDSLRYFLEDGWEKVTLYDNKIKELVVQPLGGDSVRLRVTVNIHKRYIDSGGNWKEATGMNDRIDIGVLGGGQLLQVLSYRLTEGVHVLEMTVRGKPESVRIDPGRKLIDVSDEDNERTIQ